jgi:ABC-type phosphate transport system substrate-binding protein
MKSLRKVLIAAAFSGFALVAVRAASVKVIANESVGTTTVSADDLRSVFLQEKDSLVGGSHVEAVIEKGGPTHEAFLKEYLDKSDSALQSYYRSLVFTGKGSMPKVVGSDAEMVAYVAKTKGAIGYVSADTNAQGVKTLQVK